MRKISLSIFLPFLALLSQTSADCCSGSDQSDFCIVFGLLSPTEQNEVTKILGDNCDADAEEAIKGMQKRNPNFLRFGRSDLQMRLSRSNAPNFLRFGRRDPNFLRFGKAAADPNFLRFGKRASGDPNFLRFGRQTSFDRETRQPNFLRFGRK